ncbi:MAG TPA: DNA polymerase III subunit gamma/tau [Steroidobacteraceae bacterium]|nr:DNA polymerase III subunit gamma/tau [Steroidobacteraceae bacterium]
MSYIALARKWRPRRFAEMVGQEHVLRALCNALDQGKVHHAFLFTGTRGVGKTTVARILAKSLNCEVGVSSTPCGVCAACREIDEGRFADLIEVDAASRTKVDDTRELLDNVQYAPTRGRYKVYLIDEVHMLSAHSFNALLKTLEEPPPRVKFLLATTDPQKLPVTVLSRCLQFSLKRLPVSLIAARLREIAAAEGLEAEPAALMLLARAAEGSMRDALSLLDQLIAFGGGVLSETASREMLGTVDRGHVVRIIEALGRSDGPALLAQARDLDRDAPDYDRVLVELAGALQRVALSQIVPQAAALDEETDAALWERLGQALRPEDVQLYYQIALAGRRDLPLAPDPRAGFEMVLLRMLAFRPEDAATGASPPPPAVSAKTAASGESSAASTGAIASGGRANGGPGGPAAPRRITAGPGAPTTVDAQNWSTVVEAAELSGMARQFALNCVPVALEENVLRLKVDPQAADRRTRQIEEKLQHGLGAYLGRDLRLLIEAGEEGLQTPARQRASAEQDRVVRAAAAFQEDPTVKGLRERFGAEVDVASVKPTS